MALASLQATVLQVSHLSLPFRLYGAMGARIGGAALDSPYLVDELIVKALQHEREAMARGCEEHSSINRYVPFLLCCYQNNYPDYFFLAIAKV